MKPGSGKAKGSAFEREVCKGLSLWVTGGQKSDVFWRSAMSGGRATALNKSGVLVRQAGDICAVAEEGYDLVDSYYFELKRYKDLNLPQFLIRGTGILSTFWRATIIDAESYGRRPVLIAKQDRMPAIVLFDGKPDLTLGDLQTKVTLSHFGLDTFMVRLDELLSISYRRRVYVDKLDGGEG